MKKFILILILLWISILSSGCGCTKVKAGYVGLEIDLTGDGRGSIKVLSPGHHFACINEEIHVWPLFKKTYPWTKNSREGSENDESLSFQTAEGLTVNCDIGISLTIKKEKVIKLFKTFRKGIEEIIDSYLRNEVRNSLNIVGSKYKVEAVYGVKKQQLIKEVTLLVRKKMMPQGIVIENLYLLSDFRLPSSVRKALDRKIQAIQRAEQREYELREAEAEAKKRIAEARGIAEANKIKQRSITENLLRMEAIKKWNGILPKYMGNKRLPFIFGR